VAQSVRIMHKPTGTLLAEGPLGWGITPFEGSYYISRKYLRTARFKPNFFPGLCPYKFLYVWLDLALDNGAREKNLGWPGEVRHIRSDKIRNSLGFLNRFAP
jgi:hypothetical protein